MTNDEISQVVSMPTGYYTFSEFIDAVGVEIVKVLPFVSMTFDDDHEHARFNMTSDEWWYFDGSSVDRTIDGFGRTRWFKLSRSVQNQHVHRATC